MGLSITAHQLAYEGLVRYASQPDVLSLEKAEWNVAVLTAVSHNRTEDMARVLQVRDGQIYPAQAIKTFMITTNPVIAKSDCLSYAVKATGEPLF